MMQTVLVTGSAGFIGKNLLVALRRTPGVEVLEYDLQHDDQVLDRHLERADVVFHLAGVNRPKEEAEFKAGNLDLTERVVHRLRLLGRTPRIVLSSSSQAELTNPYGVSKRAAEDVVFGFGRETGAEVFVYRLTNVFGKWCRPAYNSVVATFCHNIANGLDITISDPQREVELVYVDDVVSEFLTVLEPQRKGSVSSCFSVKPTRLISLGDLAAGIQELRDIRTTLQLPDLSDPFILKLQATYLSYLPKDDFAYPLDWKKDNRGGLAELVKSPHAGQIFVSTTHPGITRGNHYHDTKIEKFCVLKGKGIIRFRHILSDELVSYEVSGDDIRVVDIPPGYSHSIENAGVEEMVVLFWANQVFDSTNPDTYFLEVLGEKN